MTPAEQLLRQLESVQSLDEAPRSNWMRNVSTLGTSAVISSLVSQVTKRYHNLEGDVHRFRQKKKAIRASEKPRDQKRREIESLEKQFAQQLGAKIRQQRDRMRRAKGKTARGTTQKRDVRTAKRALHGNPFGW